MNIVDDRLAVMIPGHTVASDGSVRIHADLLWISPSPDLGAQIHIRVVPTKYILIVPVSLLEIGSLIPVPCDAVPWKLDILRDIHGV